MRNIKPRGIPNLSGHMACYGNQINYINDATTCSSDRRGKKIFPAFGGDIVWKAGLKLEDDINVDIGKYVARN